jgi:hypothetical protein
MPRRVTCAGVSDEQGAAMNFDASRGWATLGTGPVGAAGGAAQSDGMANGDRVAGSVLAGAVVLAPPVGVTVVSLWAVQPAIAIPATITRARPHAARPVNSRITRFPFAYAVSVLSTSALQYRRSDWPVVSLRVSSSLWLLLDGLKDADCCSAAVDAAEQQPRCGHSHAEPPLRSPDKAADVVAAP